MVFPVISYKKVWNNGSKIGISIKNKNWNKKILKKLRAQIVNLLRNARTDPKNRVSYKI